MIRFNPAQLSVCVRPSCLGPWECLGVGLQVPQAFCLVLCMSSQRATRASARRVTGLGRTRVSASDVRSRACRLVPPSSPWPTS